MFYLSSALVLCYIALFYVLTAPSDCEKHNATYDDGYCYKIAVGQYDRDTLRSTACMEIAGESYNLASMPLEDVPLRDFIKQLIYD